MMTRGVVDFKNSSYTLRIYGKIPKKIPKNGKIPKKFRNKQKFPKNS